MRIKLKERTVLVTGGAKGIGKAIAQRFLKEDFRVIVFDVEKPEYEVDFFRVDIRDEEKITKAFSKIKELDVLVNNAGIYFQSPVEETSNKMLDEIVDTNFKGTYLMCKHALPLLKKSKGNIINISSGLGVVPEPNSPAYCSTKAAIVMLTKCLAQFYASKKVRVNAILPGPIDTALLRKAFSSQKELDEYARTNPMSRIGKPEEVASIAFFLSSEQASYVTGGLYSVDGGESTSSLYTRRN